jgi:transposase
MARPTVADGYAAGRAAGPSEQSRDTAAVREKPACVGRRDRRGDHRSMAAFVGLTPSPYSSGRLQHEQAVHEFASARSRRGGHTY